MIDVESCKSMTSSQLAEQIQLRYDLINQMVGTLYPSILYDQIEKLRQIERDRYHIEKPNDSARL